MAIRPRKPGICKGAAYRVQKGNNMNIHDSLPEDWKNVILESVCEKTHQWNPKKEHRDSFFYIDVSSVSNDTFSIKEPKFTEAKAAPGRARKIVYYKDVIYATVRPTLKRIAFIPKKYQYHIVSTAFCVVRGNQNKAVPEFLYFLLLSDDINSSIAEIQHGASYPAVTDKDILSQKITLPPLPEQKKIAAVLYKIQKAIEVQGKIVESTRELTPIHQRSVWRKNQTNRNRRNPGELACMSNKRHHQE